VQLWQTHGKWRAEGKAHGDDLGRGFPPAIHVRLPDVWRHPKSRREITFLTGRAEPMRYADFRKQGLFIGILPSVIAAA
jgi:hypothetical protein